MIFLVQIHSPGKFGTERIILYSLAVLKEELLKI